MFGVAAGLSLHATFAAFGLTIVLLAVPFAFDAIKLAARRTCYGSHTRPCAARASRLLRSRSEPVRDGALLRPGVRRRRQSIRRWQCFICRCFRSSSIPAAVRRSGQSLLLGAIQISTAAAIDISLVTVAGLLAAWFARRPLWLQLQRWFLGSAFGVLAVWLALTPRHSSN